MSMTRGTHEGGGTGTPGRRRSRSEHPNGRTNTVRNGRAGIGVAGRTAGVVAAMLVTAACGGGRPALSPTKNPPSTPSANATAPADPTAAEAQIRQDWQLFFDPSTSLTDKEKYLQNGSQLAPLLRGFATDPRVGQVKAQVTNVAFTSATTATVAYTLSLQGTVVEPNAFDQAVLQDGTWKVSEATLCGLVALSGNSSAPGCS